MKKMFVASALALGLTMACQQTASAWSEFKFSAGVNMGWVGGGNRILWGAYHSAPTPGGQDLGPWFPGVAAAMNNNGYFGYQGPGGGHGYDAPAYGGHGYDAPAYPAPAFVAPAPAMVPGHQTPPPPPAHPISGLQQTYGPSSNFGFQSVGYTYSGAYYQAPSYWYGGR